LSWEGDARPYSLRVAGPSAGAGRRVQPAAADRRRLGPGGGAEPAAGRAPPADAPRDGEGHGQAGGDFAGGGGARDVGGVAGGGRGPGRVLAALELPAGLRGAGVGAGGARLADARRRLGAGPAGAARLVGPEPGGAGGDDGGPRRQRQDALGADQPR